MNCFNSLLKIGKLLLRADLKNQSPNQNQKQEVIYELSWQISIDATAAADLVELGDFPTLKVQKKTNNQTLFPFTNNSVSLFYFLKEVYLENNPSGVRGLIFLCTLPIMYVYTRWCMTLSLFVIIKASTEN